MRKTNRIFLVTGAFSILTGVAFFYFCVWKKLTAMTQQEEGVRYSFKLAAVGPFFIIMGVFYIVAQSFLQDAEEMPQTRQVLFSVVAGISIIVAIATAIWFKSQAVLLGYTDN